MALWVVSRSDAPSKMFVVLIDQDFMWTPNRDKAHRFTEDEADIFVHEFSKYSDTDIDIEGAKPVAVPAEAAA